jgi:CRP-like cAMP-binding protein
MPRAVVALDGNGPSLRAVSFLAACGPDPIELLSGAHRKELARHATTHVLPARYVIYRAGAAATSLFIIGDGAVKTFRDLRSGRRRIAAFFFARDMFGLAEAGRYVNSVETLTPCRIHELDIHTLTGVFEHHADIKLQFLAKTFHVLRDAQHHNIIMGRRDAAGRLAMLLHVLATRNWLANGGAELSIPMTRSDMANYLGLSMEAVSRASRRLELQGIVAFTGRHHARILDPRRFAAIVADV